MPTRTQRVMSWPGAGGRAAGHVVVKAAVSLGVAAVLCLAPAIGVVRAAPSYPLFYVVDIPPVLTGYEMDDQQNKHVIYTSLLRGTLGGLPIETATVTLRPGASANAGGGEFSLKTAAGTVKNGLILMTNDGRHISLLFLGTYLGARLQFRVSAAAADFGGVTVATKGLADTSFAAHSEYLAAVTQAVANLAPAPRAQAVTQADRNLRLVAAYQASPGAP